jgi:AcrR family transcriptional regulator
LSTVARNRAGNRREGCPVTTVKRIRRTPEQARRQILEAAEASMAASGPAGLRLQEVADAAGVSHPTILHHFENREGLIRAVHQRSLEELRDTLTAAFTEADAVHGVVAATFAAFRNGLAQRMQWILQSGPPPRELPVFEDMVERVHAARLQRGGGAIDIEDTRAIVHLTVVTAFGDAVIGRHLRRAATAGSDAAGAERFAAWFADWLHDRVET